MAINSLATIGKFVKHKYFTSTAAFDAYFASSEYSIYDICFVDDGVDGDGAYISCRGQVFGKQSGIIGDVESISTQVATNKSNIEENTKDIKALEDGKVDKVESHSLVEDTQIAKLTNLKSQDEITADITAVSTTAANNLASAKSELEGKITTNTANIATVRSDVDALMSTNFLVLGSDNLVPASNLPSYVDDVLEYDSFGTLPVKGEAGKIYVTTEDNITYRWSGTAYVEISKSIGLGENSSTAFPGDRGAALETKVASLTNSVSENGSAITALQSSVTTAEGNITAHTSDIATLKTDVAANTAAIKTKVDAIAGYGLSKNDFSDAYKAKVDAIETTAESKVTIKEIKLNGTTVTPEDKVVNIAVTADTLGVGAFKNLTPAALEVSTATADELNKIVAALNDVITAACWVD
jgi:hypothetical protein